MKVSTMLFCAVLEVSICRIAVYNLFTGFLFPFPNGIFEQKWRSWRRATAKCDEKGHRTYAGPSSITRAQLFVGLHARRVGRMYKRFISSRLRLSEQRIDPRSIDRSQRSRRSFVSINSTCSARALIGMYRACAFPNAF